MNRGYKSPRMCQARLIPAAQGTGTVNSGRPSRRPLIPGPRINEIIKILEEETDGRSQG